MNGKGSLLLSFSTPKFICCHLFKNKSASAAQDPWSTVQFNPPLFWIFFWGGGVIFYFFGGGGDFFFFFFTVQYSTVQYSTVQYSTVQYSTVQYSTVQYSTVQYSTVHSTIVSGRWNQVLVSGRWQIWWCEEGEGEGKKVHLLTHGSTFGDHG